MKRIQLSLASALTWCLLFLTLSGSAEDWPQWRGVGRDGVWNEQGLVTEFPEKELEILWRQPIGSGYSGPTVAAGRVFVTDRHVEPKQTESVRCFDAKSGEPLWTREYECRYVDIGYQAGPRACVTVDEWRAYALGAMGHLHCLDVKSGDVLWKKDLNQEYAIRMPIWGIAAAPLIHKNLVILQVGGRDGACMVALDKLNGDEKWKSLDDRAQYSAPILVKQAGQLVVVCWTGDSVAGLNPDSGQVHWRFPFKPKNMPIGIATPIVQGDRLFVTSFYDGSLMLRLKQNELGVEKVWQKRGMNERQTEALHSIISTPLFIDKHIYGVDSYGELRRLQADTGERIWEDTTATPKSRWSTIHFVRNGDRTWMFNERGELIIARLSPQGFDEISRAKLLAPTTEQLRRRGGVCWAHPAFANKHVFARNDKEIVCASLTKSP